MPNPHYRIEAEHERDIIRRYNAHGFEGVRSAGSKGAKTKEHKSLVDVVLWDTNEILFVASQHVPWDRNKQEMIWKTLVIRPPNSKLLFISKINGVELTENGDELAEHYGWVRV